MIEGEEILLSAQETGYRLCTAINQKVKYNSSESIFSVSFDLNNNNRLFVCLQDGALKVFDLEENTLQRYNIIFKNFSTISNDLNQNERLINFHWDKMITIPGRPDEIIFLLGVSKNLMYTGLPPSQEQPYPVTPLIVSTSRSDLPGYIYGAPVMEISSHTSRITSIAVSSTGHLFASGDEGGCIRILLLRLLDEISSLNPYRHKSKKSNRPKAAMNAFLPSYNVLHVAHDGPIFSLEWLPVSFNKEKELDKHYALATGSWDRCIRIWKISCSVTKGITVNPGIILDTLSTHMLSLSSMLFVDKDIVTQINKTELIRQRFRKQDTNPYLTENLYAADMKNTTSSSAKHHMDKAKSVFVAAGTNAGTIYVWKIEYTALLNIIGNDYDDTSDSVNKNTTSAIVTVNDFVRVEGAKLYSLLQTSDRPIIQVTMTGSASAQTQQTNVNSNHSSSGMSISSNISFAMSSNAIAESTADNGDVILAASDTQGVVRIYCPDTIEDNQDSGARKVNVTGADVSTTDIYDLQNHPIHNEYRNNRYNVDAINVNTRPLIRVGEYMYQNAVVACCFQNGSFANCTATNATSTTGNYTSSRTTSCDGTEGGYDTLTVDNASTAMSTSVASKSLLVAVAKGELFMYSTQDWSNFSTIQQLKVSNNPSKSKEIIKEMKLKHTASCDFDDLSISTNSSHDKEVENLIRSQSPKLQAKLSFCNSVQGGGNTSDNNANNKYTNVDKPYKSIVDSMAQRNKKDLQIIDKKQSTIPTSQLSNEEDSAYMVPRSKPPPKPSPLIASPISKTTPLIINKSNNNATNNDNTDNSINKIDAMMVNKLLASSTGMKSHISSKDPNTMRIPQSSPKAAATTGTLKKTLSFVSSGSPAATTTTETTEEQDNGKHDHIEIYPKTLFPDVLKNELGQPMLTSTKVIEQKLNKISKQLDQDDISVTTQQTTQSDRRLASKAAEIAMLSNEKNQRYVGLTPMQTLQQRDFEYMIDKTKPKVNKQVDPAWLLERKYGGPSEEALKILDIKDPLVTFRFNNYKLVNHPNTTTIMPTNKSSNTYPINTSSSSSSKSSQSQSNAANALHPKNNLEYTYNYNSEFGLYSEIDSASLLPVYHCEINTKQVFGDINAKNHTWEVLKSTKEDYYRNHRLDLISSASDIFK